MYVIFPNYLHSYMIFHIITYIVRKKSGKHRGKYIGKDRAGKIWGIVYTYSPYSPVMIGTKRIISAHFQDLGGEICINVMKFIISHVETYER